MNRRRQSPLPTVLAIVFAVALAVSSYANWSLIETGEFSLPGMSQPIVQAATKKKADEAAKALPEMQAVFVPARNLEAYHLVTMDDFYRDDGSLSTLLVSKGLFANTDTCITPKDSIGRVLLKPKARNQAFHPSEFFPEGTQPGITAGLPAGMVGQWVDCSQVEGLEGLAMGDMVDLMATSTILPVDPTLTPDERSRIETERRMTGLDRQAEVRRLIERAIVVRPAIDRQDPNSKKTSRMTFLAVQPSQVLNLEAALQVGDDVFAVVRSGRVEETGEFQLPEILPQDPLAPVENLPKPATIESIDGGERSSREVPRVGN